MNDSYRLAMRRPLLGCPDCDRPADCTGGCIRNPAEGKTVRQVEDEEYAAEVRWSWVEDCLCWAMDAASKVLPFVAAFCAGMALMAAFRVI